MQSTERQLTPAVIETLDALDHEPVDAASCRLAITYARAIDDARAAETWADRVLDKINKDTELYEEVQALRVKLLARVTLADLGPKLATVLVELGATPKARAAMAKGQPGRPPAAGGPLARLRQVNGA